MSMLRKKVSGVLRPYARKDVQHSENVDQESRDLSSNHLWDLEWGM